jgi:hypothetical protein
MFFMICGSFEGLELALERGGMGLELEIGLVWNPGSDEEGWSREGGEKGGEGRGLG